MQYRSNRIEDKRFRTIGGRSLLILARQMRTNSSDRSTSAG